MRRYKGTKKRHAALATDGSLLFGYGVKVSLWPNGTDSMYISDGVTVFELTASTGCAGFSITLHACAGADTSNITTRVSDADYHAAATAHNTREVTVTAYRTDARSQAFRRWYDHEETAADVAILGPEYGRGARRGRTTPRPHQGADR